LINHVKFFAQVDCATLALAFENKTGRLARKDLALQNRLIVLRKLLLFKIG
jgi:hypothetical protein